MSYHNVSIAAVGDIMLGDSAKCIGFGVRSLTTRLGIDYLFAETTDALKADIIFGNLECVLDDVAYCSWNFSKAQMIGVPSSARALAKAGFTVLNVANNHTMQHGPIGFVNTCRLIEKEGIALVGLRGSDGYLCKPLVVQVGGRRIGMLGYGCHRDNYFPDYPLYAQGKNHEIAADVQRLSHSCDSVVVSLHWGDEFVQEPSAEMTELAHQLIDAGACLVLGHHPHVLQRIESYRGGVICYSLGNFISDMLWDDNLRHGVVVACEVGSDACIKKVLLTKTADDYHVKMIGNSLGPFTALPITEPYPSHVERLRIRNRNLSHMFVLKNFYRYNPFVLFQIVFSSCASLLGFK